MIVHESPGMRMGMRSAACLLLAAVGPACASQRWPAGEKTSSESWGAALTTDELERIAVIRRVCPSIVHVEALVRLPGSAGASPEERLLQLGSGVTWDRAGHVVTNLHVIRGSDFVRVVLKDGSSWAAHVLGTDPQLDIAVLGIDVPADKLVPADVRADLVLEVGQTAMAFGNPFGLDHTLTVGVISALGREMQTESGDTLAGLVQTDAAVNPGSSGGALVDSRGRLIGINVALVSPSEVFAGIGYAIPIAAVERAVRKIVSAGSTAQSSTS